jgi:hypothetical protein
MNNQISPYEFLSFVKTPGEKHIGIAAVRYERRFIFRFKVAPSSVGSGLWVTKAAYKCGSRPDGKDQYEDAFEFDSNYEKKQLDDFVQQHVSAILAQQNAPAQVSAFSPPLSSSYLAPQPEQNHAHQAQPYSSYEPQFANNTQTDDLPF